MSKRIAAAFVAGMVTAACVPVATLTAYAADLPSPPWAAHARCGPCGSLHVGYVYHRELRSTYGVGFDPRNFDQTQAYYYFGPVRAYPRYWVDADPVQ